MELNKCFVDANFKIVYSYAEAKAIVNCFKDGKTVQVLFLEPIGHNFDFEASKKEVIDWAKLNFPHYAEKATLPAIETCCLANKGETGFLPITSCFCAKNVAKVHENWHMSVDEMGWPMYACKTDKQFNVYPALNLAFDDSLMDNLQQDKIADFCFDPI